MIVFINGTYGVGKTTTGRCLINSFIGGDSVLYDADYSVVKEINIERFNHFFKLYGWECTASPAYLEVARKNIESLLVNHETVIVPMTLAHENGKKYIIDHFLAMDVAMEHFILEADKLTTIMRIAGHEERDQELALKWLDANTEFLKANYSDAVRINTEYQTPYNVAKRIAETLNPYEFYDNEWWQYGAGS